MIVPKYSYVTFLAGTPTPEAIAKGREYETGDDCWDVIGSRCTSATPVVPVARR